MEAVHLLFINRASVYMATNDVYIQPYTVD